MEIRDNSSRDRFIASSYVDFDDGLTVPYLKVGMDQSPLLRLYISDPSNRDEVESGVQRELLSKFWFLDKNIRQEELVERYGIALDDGVEVDLYNFQKGFDKQKLDLVAGTLARFYGSLKDKSLWNVDSIQVRSKDRTNGKSGQPFRGLEHPGQRRFELFPSSFEAGLYRNSLDCTWAEGATVHEATHIVLESHLASLWNDPSLGWEVLQNQLVMLPGGFESVFYNRDYLNLPTDYAAYQPDDDRAETVVAYLFDQQKLNEHRRNIMSEVFTRVVEHPFHKIVKKDPKLPELPNITVGVEPLQAFFSSRGVVRNTGQKNPTIPLEEYRKMRQAI